MKRKLVTLGLITCLAAPLPAAPADRPFATTPGRTAEVLGSVIELGTDDGRFLAIHRDSQRGERRGAVLLLHDQSTHANSLEIVRPLRLGLAQAGWDTLSLQLPTAYPGESSRVWQGHSALIQARTKAGLDWLVKQGLRNQAIIAIGDSSGIAVRFAAEQRPRELRALVLVSAGPGGTDGDTALRALRIPLLDVRAERDIARVIDAASGRRTAAAGTDLVYRQVTVPQALPGFRASEDRLVADIRAWLAVNAEGGETAQ